MDSLKVILGRIERRLKAVGLSANAASKQAGKPEAIRNIKRAVREGAKRAPNMKTLQALVPVLRTTVAWLTEGSGPEDTEASERPSIPIWGKSGAGKRILNFRQEGTEIARINAPAGFNDRTGGVEIEGDSLGRVFNGWYAIYDDVRDPPTLDLIGELCVLEDAEGYVYIKRLQKGRGKRFKLESEEPPIYDVEIKWAARVKNVVPR